MAFPTGWLCQSALVVQHSQVTANQTAFPVLITEASFATNCPEILTTGNAHAAQSDGGDLRFSTDSAGASQIACEVVTWSQNATFASAKAEIHVPRDILTGADVTIYVWWSGGGGLSQPAAGASFGSQAVWDANYKTVKHLQSATTESTSSGLSLTNINGSFAAAKIGSGITLNGSNAEVVGSDSILPFGTNPRTFSIWINPSDNVDRCIMSYGNLVINQFFGFYRFGTGTQLLLYLLDNVAGVVSATISSGSWSHVVITLNSTTVEFFLNGVSKGTISKPSLNTVSGTQGVKYGVDDNTGSSAWFKGTIDEPRFSNIVRSSSWIATEYNNQNSPGTFVIAGTRTDLGSSGGPFPHYTRRLLSGGFSPMSGGIS